MRKLSVRLFASYAVVIAVGSIAAFVTARLLAPSLFSHSVGGWHMGGTEPGHGPAPGLGPGSGRGLQLEAAFTSALTSALLVAVGVSILAGGLAAAFVARRLLRPLDDVRAATRRLADGHYDERIPPPREEELAALALDVNDLADRLAETEQRRVRLISEVAHEMRTPLTTIDGYVEGLLDGIFAPTPEVLTAVSEEVDRLQRLSADLSALSRAEEGALDLQLAPVDLLATAGRVAGRLRPQFEDAQVALEVRPGPALPVRADDQRLAQVLTNLLGNALRYTPPGGRVRVTGEQQEGSCSLSITDTGVGLRPEEVERVFERFYRGSSASAGGGTGIGLTIARAIARAHGGEVTAVSPGPGRGSTFTIRLPSAIAARSGEWGVGPGSFGRYGGGYPPGRRRNPAVPPGSERTRA